MPITLASQASYNADRGGKISHVHDFELSPTHLVTRGPFDSLHLNLHPWKSFLKFNTSFPKGFTASGL